MRKVGKSYSKIARVRLCATTLLWKCVPELYFGWYTTWLSTNVWFWFGKNVWCIKNLIWHEFMTWIYFGMNIWSIRIWFGRNIWSIRHWFGTNIWSIRSLFVFTLMWILLQQKKIICDNLWNLKIPTDLHLPQMT